MVGYGNTAATHIRLVSSWEKALKMSQKLSAGFEPVLLTHGILLSLLV